jgi:hypothetical protein
LRNATQVSFSGAPGRASVDGLTLTHPASGRPVPSTRTVVSYRCGFIYSTALPLLRWRRATIGNGSLTPLQTFLHPQLILFKLLFLVVV